MNQIIIKLVDQAINALQKAGVLPDELPELPRYVERTADAKHGDFASNIAMILAKVARCKPRDLAEQLVAHLPASELIDKVEIAGPGFINFFLSDAVFHEVVKQVFDEQANYGRSMTGSGQRVHIEFVSANPTGPLHVGHGRSAAYGDVVANLLEAVGFHVHREYYVNDAGRQMNILALSVWLRYLEACGEPITFPEKAYQGDYVKDIAQDLKAQVQERLCHPAEILYAHLSAPDEDQGETPDQYLDRLIERAQSLLGKGYYREVFEFGLQAIERDIKHDLENFGVCYQGWFHESELIENGMFEASLERLKQAGYAYEKEGALWFKASDFGDEKDRVLTKSNGDHTYFASDIAYHLHKYEQGYDRMIDIFGSDHHGYVSRIRGFLKALGCDDEKLAIVLVQFVTLYRGTERVSMSTRSGEFVTLRDLYEDVGRDATRFFYVMRKMDQSLDFDLELAKSQSSENPVYYIQYAHARVCAVFRQLEDKPWDWDQAQGLAALSSLTNTHEIAVMRYLSDYPTMIEVAAARQVPHHVTRYLQELANAFHSYYNAHQFLVEDEALRNARLCLIVAVRQVLANGLDLLGVSAPVVMPELTDTSVEGVE